MIKTFIFLLVSMMFYSCNEKAYREIVRDEFDNLTVQKTLLANKNYSVLKVGKSITDEYPNLVVRYKDTDKILLFEDDCELMNDSIIVSYYPAFIIDSEGEFRKNGLWVYADFYREGTFPFTTRGTKFGVDSIPGNWNQSLPDKEGIYYYHDNSLELISEEQSEDKFREKEKDGFYFFPNTGRLYDKINLNELE